MGGDRPRRRWALVLAAVLLAAAAPPSPERQLQSLAAADARVLSVGDRLARAGASLCPVRAPRFGLALHSLGQYAPTHRPAARRLWGLGDGLAVLALAPGGPAESANLRVGDALTAIDGLALAPEVDAISAVALLEQRGGPVSLDIQRSGQRLRVRIAPVAGCRSNLRLVTARRPRASADGTWVSMTTPLLALTRDDHELAFVLAHEIAHNAWGHAALRARPDGRCFRKAMEFEADANALRLMQAAGFEPGRAVPFLERLYDGPAGGLFGPGRHLGRRERLAAIRARLQSKIHSRLLPGRNSRPAESIA